MSKEKLDSTRLSVEPEYDCLICKDVGVVHPVENGKVDYSQLVPCMCRAEAIIKERQQRMLKYCFLPADTEGWTLKKFEAYTDTLKKALAAASEVAKPDGNIKWLTLIGGVETGKSHLAVAICREWLKHDIPARYVGVPTMLDELRATYDKDAEDSFLSKMHFYQNVPLLVLDDLGVEKLTDWGYEKLYSIINSRLENGFPLVVTTNVDISAIPGDKEHRIGSRLLRHKQGKVITMGVKDYSVHKGRR